MNLSPTEYRYQVLWPLLQQKTENREAQQQKVEKVKEAEGTRKA